MSFSHTNLPLWFDVESRYKATCKRSGNNFGTLWFDVESRYKATKRYGRVLQTLLWFDVESRYKATSCHSHTQTYRCGLM